jgi:hypothetical protein
MHLKRLLPLLMILALPLISVAQNTHVAEPAKADAAGKGDMAANALGIAIPAAPADQAQVVFFRSHRLLHSINSSSLVQEGDSQVGTLKNGAYFVRLTAPGKHTYSVEILHKDVLTVDLEAGKTYYVRENMRVGVLTERPYLERAEQADFDEHVQGMTRVD